MHPKFVLIITFLLAMLCIANAQEVTIDLTKLSPQEAAQVVAAKKTEQKTTVVPEVPSEEKVEKWVTIGERIGQAIAGACRELSVEVNDFITTPAGKLTVFLIAWQVVGEDFWNIIGGSLGWIIITGILLWSFRHFHMNERTVIKNGETEEIKYIPRYKFDDDSYETGSFWMHCIMFILFTIMFLIIIF